MDNSSTYAESLYSTFKVSTEVDSIVSRVLGQVAVGRSVGIVGARGLGKSTIATRVRENLTGPNESIPIGVSVKISGREKNPYEIVEVLRDALAANVALRLGGNGEEIRKTLCQVTTETTVNPIVSMIKRIRKDHNLDRPIVLIIDDFHRIGAHEWREDFLANLESELYATRENARLLNCAFFGDLRMVELLQNVPFSDLWQNLETTWLTPLHDRTIRDAILALGGTDAEKLTTRMSAVSGNHPSVLYAMMLDGLDNTGQQRWPIDIASHSFLLPDLRRLFEAGWEHTPDAARNLIESILTRGRIGKFGEREFEFIEGSYRERELLKFGLGSGFLSRSGATVIRIGQIQSEWLKDRRILTTRESAASTFTRGGRQRKTRDVSTVKGEDLIEKILGLTTPQMGALMIRIGLGEPDSPGSREDRAKWILEVSLNSPSGEERLRLSLGEVIPNATKTGVRQPLDVAPPDENKTGDYPNRELPRQPANEKTVVAEVPRDLGPSTAQGWRSVQVIQAMRPSGWSGLYIIGSFDRQITFYSEQVRALNLIRAMFDTGVLDKGHRVGVVGAGAAGVTAAVAAARLGCEVTLFEERDSILHLQAPSRQRFLHPHLYDWPEEGSLQPSAGLPLLNWTADLAFRVITEQLRPQFERESALAGRRLSFKPRTHVSSIRRITGEIELGWNESLGRFSAPIVLITIGFGREAHGSYWSGDSLSESTPGQTKRILISGAGDGGLIDLARAALRSGERESEFRHDQAIQLLTKEEIFVALAKEMSEVDRTARIQSATTGEVDLYATYEAKITLRPEIVAYMKQLRRSGTEVVFNYKDTGVFKLDSALLNRMLGYLLIKCEIVRPKQGTLLPPIAIGADGTKDVTIESAGGRRSTENFHEVIERHGPIKNYFAAAFPELQSACSPLMGRVAELNLAGTMDRSTADWYTSRLTEASG